MHAVADAKNGNAELEDRLIAMRRAGLVNAGRSPAENDASRLQGSDALGRNIVTHDLTENVLVAHASSNELPVLGAKIKDQNPLLIGSGGRDR